MLTWFNRLYSYRFITGSIVLCCSIGILTSTTLFADTIEDAREAIEKWVETKRIISKEKHDLAIAKEMLNERIELVQNEIKSLRDKIKDAEDSIAEADKKRAELIEENDKLKEASSALGDTLQNLEQRTLQLMKQVPKPLQEKLKPLSQQIPENPEETELSISIRFQNVVGVLNSVNKSNLEITVVSEVRTLPDGNSAEVTTMYLGIGQAFYIGANGTIAGVGVPAEDGWKWTPANDFAQEISNAIAILNNEQVAAYVQVPVKIQ